MNRLSGNMSIAPNQVMTGNPYSPINMKLLTLYCSNHVDLQFLAELDAGGILVCFWGKLELDILRANRRNTF